MSLRQSTPWVTPVHGLRQVSPDEASALLSALRRLVDHELPSRFHTTDPTQPPLSLDEAYRWCIDITRVHSRSFFLSSHFLPPEKRRAIRALYAFCRTSDDIVDQLSENVERELAHWVALAQAPTPPQHHPVLVAWKDTVSRYTIPQALANELLAGVAMDLTVSRYATFDDLWLYCYRVASVVGLISMCIIGHEEGATPYAVSLGVALQLTNILRDVGEDAQRGRIYLPQEDMQRFGLSDDDILQGRCDERFHALMRFEIERAHALYDEAWPGIALLSRDSQFAIGAAAEVYRGILNKIVANRYDVFSQRARLSMAEKLRTLPRVARGLRALPRVQSAACGDSK
ncbi:MAG TPA: phytoene/squalene synthase family protein [Roseiflexaceae bacterium]|nr:phytoene/squalene synthase family protein [Roseiflexaceae bacterium]